MIEKFSPEELRQIKKELGIVEPDFFIRKEDVLKDEKQFVKNLLCEKYDDIDRIFTCICTIIDVTINNTERYRTRPRSENAIRFIVNKCKMRADDCQEYKEMLHEILDIIKKHNRPYIEDGVKKPE